MGTHKQTISSKCEIFDPVLDFGLFITKMGQDQITCPWDDGVDNVSEDDEDWLFSSIKQYRHLYMVNVNINPRSICMSPDNRSLALADHDRGHLEVYRLPGKLVASSEQEEGLTSNRDFTLECGSVECDLVTSVRYLGHNCLVTTNDQSQTVSLWQWRDDEDLMEKQSDLCQCDFQPVGVEVTRGPTDNDNVVTVHGDTKVGRTTPGVPMLDSRHVIHQPGASISSILTRDMVTWVLDDRMTVVTLDWRMSKIAAEVSLQDGDHCSLSSLLLRDDEVRVVTCNSGEIKLWEVKNSKQPLCRTSLSGVGGGPSHLTSGGDDVVVSAGGHVIVLDVNDLKQKFDHRGHRSEVTGVFRHSTRQFCDQF